MTVEIRVSSPKELNETQDAFGCHDYFWLRQCSACFFGIQSFSPVRELRADQVLSLGSLVTEMADRELQATALTDPGVLTHLGTLTHWSPKKVNFIYIFLYPDVKHPKH